MHPYIAQLVAAERVKDMRIDADNYRRAREARQGRKRRRIVDRVDDAPAASSLGPRCVCAVSVEASPHELSNVR